MSRGSSLPPETKKGSACSLSSEVWGPQLWAPLSLVLLMGSQSFFPPSEHRRICGPLKSDAVCCYLLVFKLKWFFSVSVKCKLTCLGRASLPVAMLCSVLGNLENQRLAESFLTLRPPPAVIMEAAISLNNRNSTCPQSLCL